ncbi:MAG: pentapeptide repeat-containing protein [Chlorogloeopsis fritschii C42_A2020_084]|uniref:nSTAND1 domain-containing NTPase n=1 Tax=Chlorogloeopsis fritschii TaxID=1124 RepID=UPI0019DED511|nr:pentapeptide repeat-containing protein [Chlorogloeopsis fritschii]MBF2009489.1 pentapeptide repeat-containing protein [Chlorogloeopsis fritschii C42_A2020_084]
MTNGNITTDGQQPHDRRVEIHRDVINSAIVSGDNNKVVIYHYYLEQLVQNEGKSLPSKLKANPYRGLAAFQVEDADVYFGREKEVDRLWNRLWNLYEHSQHNKSLPRLLPILGPSGSGKSSLARAGLLPELARRPLPGHQQTRVIIVKPGETPLEKLALILARIATGDPSPVGKAQEFKEVLEKKHEQGSNDGLSFIASILPEQDYPLVVLVDQFEEIYAPDADFKQRTAFVETLLEAAVTRKAQVSVVITLRSDFLGETQRHPKLNQIIGSDQSVFLPVMTSDELRLAIEKPAEQAGHPLDFATVDQLVEQTEGRAGALPLLQFALTRIWKELSDNNFSKSSKDILRQIGGVGGALAGEAEVIYQSLDSQGQDITRRVFVGLVQIREGVRYTRRRVKVSSLLSKQEKREQVREVLNRFSSPNARLITLSSIDGEEVAEVTHEALFENWKQLRVWLDGQCDLLRQRDKIENAADDWRKRGKSKGDLLQGKRLKEAKDFLKIHTANISLNDLATELIQRSSQQQRNNRLTLIGLGFIAPIGLAIFVGRQIVIYRLRQTVAEAYGQKIDFARFSALQDLVKLNAPLEGIDLSGATLFRINLSGANLQNANFSGGDTQLSFAHLERADLRGANLSSAQFNNAYLSNGNLSGTNTNLFDTNLDSAHLENADLSGAQLERAKFIYAHLSGANLSGSYLENTDFKNADLNGANLNGANLSGSKNLTYAQIKSACNWQEAIYKLDPSYSNYDRVNQEFIEAVKQDIVSNPKQPIDCSKWKR